MPQSVHCSDNLIDLVIAQAGVSRFFDQPIGLKTLELLCLKAVGGLAGVEIRGEGGKFEFIFNLTAPGGEIHTCRCNPAAFAMLLTIIIIGQSIFIDYEGGKSRNPYLKVCGRTPSSAGIVFGRVINASREGEVARYANGDTLDLTYSNVVEKAGTAKRDFVDFYGEALRFSHTLPDQLYAGSPAIKSKLANDLLQLAMDSLYNEREEYLASR